jgi:photosystem II stability/assembly factor-like uncharacterized protein
MPFVLLLAAPLVARWIAIAGPVDLASITDVAVDAGSDRQIYVSTLEVGGGSAIYRSDDAGAGWIFLLPAPGAERFTKVQTDPRVPGRLFACGRHEALAGPTMQLYRSGDAGAHWTVPQEAFLSPSCEIAFDALDPETVYVSYENTLTLWRSRDGGETFSGFASPFRGALLASAADGMLLAASGTVVFVSGNRGQTWSSAKRTPVECPIRAIAADPANANLWYVGSGQALFPCGEVARTDDGGDTWTHAAATGGPIFGLATDPAQPGLFYVATGRTEPSVAPGRVLATRDGGDTWIDLGGPKTDGLTALAVPENAGRIYAATDAGVYALDLRRLHSTPPR